MNFCANGSHVRSVVGGWLPLGALVLAVLASPVAGSESADPKVAELERRLAELEAALAAVRAGGSADPRIAELEIAVEVLSEEVETLKLGEAAVEVTDQGRYGLGPAASKVYGVERGVSLGGYGEAVYENYSGTREDGEPSGRSDQIDFLRLVLYAGYKFNDRIVFNSEIEFEHASTGKTGEVSVELAYLDFLLSEHANVRAGMYLVPMGFVNELHEPPVFLGARRPYVEQLLIPSTWREVGVGSFGEFGPLTYRAYVGTSLTSVGGTSSKATGFSASGIRDGRASGSKAAAEDLAFTGRLDWNPARSLTVGTALFTGDTGQGQTGTIDGDAEEIGGRTTVWDVHLDWRWRALQTRALYVHTTIGDVEWINAAQELSGDDSVGERQHGWYGEVGYDVLAHRQGRQALIPFARYERWNTQDEVPDGFESDPANDATVMTVGISWKPILNVAVKADWNKIENDARTGTDQLNVALGFMF